MSARTTLPIAAALVLALACSGESGEDESGLAEEPMPLDSMTAAEQEEFALDPSRFPEMQGPGPLDSINMTGRSPAGDAAWNVQVLNYSDEFLAMTYAAWYTGPDSLVQFAADGQPYLVDEEGNRYDGVLTPTNPRLKVETDNTAVGVFAFAPGLTATADSLTLYVNDSTAPVIRVGPWPIRQGALRAASQSPQPGTR